ncbi:MAG: efflux RND transporter periplasmic adaptor subunit [Gammaproteobacteria bacterium]|nr:efflux RND transporter periplasmic adaptor subunit [Gammaproteobacteria bacterium]
MSNADIQIKKLSLKYILILILCVICLIAILLVTSPQKKPELREIAATQVMLQPIAQQLVQPIKEVSGYLQPVRSSALSFELSGQVLARHVEPGDRVNEGDVLITLKRGDQQDALAEAKAQLSREHKAIERDQRILKLISENRTLQAREVTRLEQLGQKSLASRSMRDNASQLLIQQQREEEQLKYSVDTSKARLELKRAAVRRAQRNLARTAISAPYSGTINAVHVETGDYVTPNQVVVELLQLKQLDLNLDVNGTTAAMLSLQQAVMVTIKGEQHRGKIIALQTSPDAETFTHAVRVRLDGKGLQAGAPATATLELKALPNALVVPVSAILHHNDKSFIFIAEAGTLRRVAVTLSARQGQSQVVSGAIQAGEMVVARDVAFLTDGQSVEHE